MTVFLTMSLTTFRLRMKTRNEDVLLWSLVVMLRFRLLLVLFSRVSYPYKYFERYFVLMLLFILLRWFWHLFLRRWQWRSDESDPYSNLQSLVYFSRETSSICKQWCGCCFISFLMWVVSDTILLPLLSWRKCKAGKANKPLSQVDNSLIIKSLIR